MPIAQPESAAAAQVKLKSLQLANGAGPILPIVEQHQVAEAPAVTAKLARLVPAADEQACSPTRVFARSNKGQPPRRCRPPSSSKISTIAFTFVLFLFFAAIAGAQDVLFYISLALSPRK